MMAYNFSAIMIMIIIITEPSALLVCSAIPVPNEQQDVKKVLTTWKDLEAGGLSRHDLIKLYKQNYGRPPHSKEYGKYCYNILGDASVLRKSIMPRNIVGDLKTLKNYWDEPATFSVTLEATHEKSASLSVTRTSSFSFSEKISITSVELGITSELYYEFEIENSVSSESTTSDTITIKDSVDITLQPNSSVLVRLDIRWQEENAEIEIPINIVGYTGGDYPKPMDGHHYWFPWLPDWVQLKSSIHANMIVAYDIQGEITLQKLD